MKNMRTAPQNPYLPEIIAEILASPIYLRFLGFLDTYGINRICDCHAHISSGKEDTVGDAPPELMPQYPFSIGDVNLLYEALFRGEGIEATSVVFDTPLPAYDLARKNSQLLDELHSTKSSKTVVPFAVVTPEMTTGQIEGWVEGGAKGFKMTPRTSSPYVKRGVISDVSLAEMLNPAALRIADSHRLPLVVHLPQLVVSPRIKPSLKDELVEIVGKYPNLKIVLAHLGQAQTPAKIDDLLGWMEKNGLWEHVWMDISAVTVPSVLAIAMASKARLVFGTDIDFALTERGRYISFKIVSGQRTLADNDDNGNVITALVSTNFGAQLKEFAAEQGINLNAPLIVFQFEGILSAVERLQKRGKTEAEIKSLLERLFFRNAEAILSQGDP